MADKIHSLVNLEDENTQRIWLEELRESHNTTIDEVETNTADIAALETDLTVEAWRNVSTDAVSGFENSWATSTVAAFYKDPFGVVHIKGQLDTGTSGTTAFTLPVGYRPPETAFFTALGVGGAAGNYVAVTAAGAFQPTRTGANININQISFRAA